MSALLQHIFGKITPEDYEHRKLLDEVQRKGMITKRVKYASTLDYLESAGCSICWECPKSGNDNSRVYRIMLY